MGKKRKKPPYNYKAQYRELVFQKMRIQKNFPCFKCTLQNDTLKCHGLITPDETRETYKISILKKYYDPPKVFIKSPIIEEPNSKIHRYNDKSLCLYDWRDKPWKKHYLIDEKLIPWISEWIIFYELYKETGEWLGPEAPHSKGSNTKQQQTLHR